MAAPWFFDRLGLPATADARAIKRAYAQALKRVDQQTEREAFERLREAYEEALAWARLLAADAQQEAVLADVPADSIAAEQPGVADDIDGRRRAGDERDRGGLDDGQDGVYGLERADIAGDVDSGTDAGTDIGTDTDDADCTDCADDTDDPHGDPNPTWSAIQHWIARLMNAGDAAPDLLLGQALDDPRLWHLDGRTQFESRLIAALRREPLGQAALFEAASARFDWPARRASVTRSHPQDVWVSRVIDQALLWESMPPPARARLARAMKAVRATDAPTRRQAFRHQPALYDLQREFFEWSSLFLAPARVDAWRQAHDDMPANELRRFRVERGLLAILGWCWRVFMAIFRFMRDNIFDTWLYRLAGGFLLVAFVATWLAGGFDGDHRTAAQQNSDNVMRLAQANARRVGTYAPREAGQAMPVPLHELPGKLDRRSCRATHAVLHKRDPHVFGDRELIASLGAHAMLCTVNYHWPAMADPIVRCLELESWSAADDRRPQDNAHCAQAETKR